jgi:hypothetical protein
MAENVTGAAANCDGQHRLLSSAKNKELAKSTKSFIPVPALMKLTKERMQQSNDFNIKNTSAASFIFVALSFSLNTLIKTLLSIFYPKMRSVEQL